VRILLLVAGCESEQIQVFDAPPPQLSIDVVATASRIWLRTHDTDRTCDCRDDSAQFATFNACIGIDDILCGCPPPSSCLRTNLVANGTRLLPPSTGPGLMFELPDPRPSELSLELSGCDYPDVSIPIDAFTAPTPTMNVDVDADARSLTARWQTDMPATTTYVQFALSLWSHECHTTASEQPYALGTPSLPPYATVTVTTFLPVVTTYAPLGEVRLWRGNEASMFLQLN
jgi:hypothetical protein